MFTGQSAPPETLPLPAGLPSPVERYYRQTYGAEIPVIQSAVLSGRGTVRFMGITFPARLRFSHVSGKDYRHYIEATFFGYPVFKVNEHYLDGHTRLDLPVGVVENDPKVDSAANQGLWAESLAYPAIFDTDPRVRWEYVDDTHARLSVPYGDAEQVFTVQFDAQSGELTRAETDRYRDEKVGMLRWWGEKYLGNSQSGQPASVTFAVTWEDEGTPWLVYELEESVFNADLTDYIRQTGP